MEKFEALKKNVVYLPAHWGALAQCAVVRVRAGTTKGTLMFTLDHSTRLYQAEAAVGLLVVGGRDDGRARFVVMRVYNTERENSCVGGVV